MVRACLEKVMRDVLVICQVEFEVCDDGEMQVLHGCIAFAMDDTISIEHIF